MRYLIVSFVVLVAGCVAEVVPPRVEVVAPAPAFYVPPPPPPVVSVYVEPPLVEPAPIAIGWAPPAMLVETPPPPPFAAAVWVGGYWEWQGNWVWAHGHWVSPPQPGFVFMHPYYENRDGAVIFVGGHWSAPGVAFVPPPLGLHLSLEVAAVGVIPGPRPIGPNGCFVPAPPGSRAGIIIPAPIGTAPAVVTGAPPVVAVGMRITNVNNTTIRNTTVVNNINVTNVTIVAPPSATASGRAFNTSVPAQAHLAAAQTPVVHAQAPEPLSTKAIPAYVPGRRPAALPPAQAVNSAASVHPMEAAHALPAAHEAPPAARVENAAPRNDRPSPPAAERKVELPRPALAQREDAKPARDERKAEERKPALAKQDSKPAKADKKPKNGEKRNEDSKHEHSKES